jgi:iron-sulfur cluster repair protein YtfE (RIC family)
MIHSAPIACFHLLSFINALSASLCDFIGFLQARHGNHFRIKFSLLTVCQNILLLIHREKEERAERIVHVLHDLEKKVGGRLRSIDESH